MCFLFSFFKIRSMFSKIITKKALTFESALLNLFFVFILLFIFYK